MLDQFGMQALPLVLHGRHNAVDTQKQGLAQAQELLFGASGPTFEQLNLNQASPNMLHAGDLPKSGRKTVSNPSNGKNAQTR